MTDSHQVYQIAVPSTPPCKGATPESPGRGLPTVVCLLTPWTIVLSPLPRWGATLDWTRLLDSQS